MVGRHIQGGIPQGVYRVVYTSGCVQGVYRVVYTWVYMPPWTQEAKRGQKRPKEARNLLKDTRMVNNLRGFSETSLFPVIPCYSGFLRPWAAFLTF